ncbi:YeeE/YedE family protein [Puniceibacterium confluentis]|uniref:YeeE/YedE family protein n=1 Tax=Puniceibacterium confluentis TaxID=1958944 RepID=UPI0011B82867|nr:YeeE/YedE family protein [Puniceibacterium confluentis]
MRMLFAFIAGSLFGIGLHLSGMTDTAKVQGFLDIFGNWDPTLAFVMGGAIVPMSLAWRLAQRRAEPLAGGRFPAPPTPRLDRRLVTGSVMFGMGWGLAGLCPGPAIAALSYGGAPLVVFVLAMLAGMWLAPRARSYLDSTVPAE